MFITGLGTAVPLRRYSQRECWEAARVSPQFQRLGSRARAIVRTVLGSTNGVVTRHLALDNISQIFEVTPDALHQRFVNNAPMLAAQAGERALANAGARAEEVDAVLISTCTGYLCPGLTSYVTERLGLRPDVFALDLVGQGCGAAMPNLRAAEALLAAGRCGTVLSICAEICSAAFYLDDDPGVLISACIFGDGAGAAVLTGSSKSDGRRVEWKETRTLVATCNRDLLRFEQRGGMLRNILRPEVPLHAAQYAAEVLESTLANSGVRRDQIRGWILHPGGKDVLVALRERLKLDEADLRWSAAVLAEFGNLSSPSVLFVLQRALSGGMPGGFWWMSSFGAGFSCAGALLQVA